MKRAREKDVWPEWFYDRWLAQLVFAFVQDLQLEHWVITASNADTQTMLWERLSKGTKTSRCVIHALLRSNNTGCLRQLQVLSHLDWYEIFVHGNPESLASVMQGPTKEHVANIVCNPKSFFSAWYEQIPLCNLKFIVGTFAFCDHWRQCTIRSLARNFSEEPDDKLLFLLRSGWNATFDKFKTLALSREKLELFVPFIQTGQVEIATVYDYEFIFIRQIMRAKISDATLVLLQQMGILKGDGPGWPICAHAIMTNKPMFAASCWTQHFDADAMFTFLTTTRFAKFEDDSCYRAIRLTTWESSDSEDADYDELIFAKRTTSACFASLNNLIKTQLNEPANPFQSAVFDGLRMYANTVNVTEWFHYSCVTSSFYIVKFLWSISAGMHSQLRQILADFACFNFDQQLLDFAWEHARPLIKTQRWTTCAFNSNNLTLWQFLHAKGALTENVLSPDEVLKLGSKRRAFLSTVWQKTEFWLNVAPRIATYALHKNRGDVLRFLSRQGSIHNINRTLCLNIFRLTRLNLFDVAALITTQEFESHHHVLESYNYAMRHRYTEMVDVLMKIAPIGQDALERVTRAALESIQLSADDAAFCIWLLQTNKTQPYNVLHALQKADVPHQTQLEILSTCDFDIEFPSP